MKIIQAAARQKGIKVLPVDARTPEEIERGYATMKRESAEAVIVVNDPFLALQRWRIAELALKNRMPSMSATREEVQAGGLMSYGTNLADLYRRTATVVDKILKGARPADLPVEQPTVFEMVIKMKTAKALGIKVPQAILLHATKVIE